MSVNSHGSIIVVMDTLNLHKTTIATKNSGFPLPPCVDVTAIDRLCFVCWLRVGSLAMCAIVLWADTLKKAR